MPVSLGEIPELALHVQLVLLHGKRSHRERQHAFGARFAVQHRIPQRDPRSAARERVWNGGQVPHQPAKRPGVEVKFTIGDPAAGGENELGRRQAACPGHFGARGLELHRQMRDSLRGRYHDVDPLVPCEAAACNRIAFGKRQPADAAVRDAELCRDDRPSTFLDPGPAPRGQVLRRPAVENRNEIGP